MLLVRVGDVEFHGHTSDGFLIGPGGFKGWEGAPATKRSQADRPGADGVTRVPAFKGARLVSLAGTALASSEAGLAHLGDVLAGVGARDARVTVTTAAGTRWADGSVEGPITFDRTGGAAEASFALSFLFSDPFKYGESRTFEATGTGITTSSMFHRGNTDAVPRFRVTGTFPNGYSLFAGDRIVQVSGSASAVTDDLDMYTGRFVRNGSMDPRLMQIARFWSVPGGSSKGWAFDRKSGTGTATATLTDTYL